MTEITFHIPSLFLGVVIGSLAVLILASFFTEG